jgi:hypothetical protein
MGIVTGDFSMEITFKKSPEKEGELWFHGRTGYMHSQQQVQMP